MCYILHTNVALSILTRVVGYMTAAPFTSEYNHEVLGSVKKIEQTINIGNMNIARYEENSRHMVSTAKDSINESYDQLRRFIKESSIEALKIGVNIDDCLIPTTHMNCSKTNDLEKCTNQKGPTSLRRDLEKIARAIQFLVPADIYSFDTRSDPKIKNCTRNELNKYEVIISELHERVDTVLSDALNACFQCVEATLSKLDVNINSVAHDFMRCVDRYLG